MPNDDDAMLGQKPAISANIAMLSTDRNHTSSSLTADMRGDLDEEEEEEDTNDVAIDDDADAAAAADESDDSAGATETAGSNDGDDTATAGSVVDAETITGGGRPLDIDSLGVVTPAPHSVRAEQVGTNTGNTDEGEEEDWKATEVAVGRMLLVVVVVVVVMIGAVIKPVATARSRAS
jgi:hypothetical protein